ncbi:subtilisin-like serine protease QhpE [Neptunomonas qingdaonensis]|uniref:Subtilase family protein n=1 Tax=Neptunomonas qingdaonensis TaxID=1045558 RepID=A0A1I2P2A1_9GAMM|nr:S8 family serine peptidase [Neptunomonas qingdaonensis]SFG10302.1 Subtilase family protein [Neptunomonas qingdaonensis]
MSESIDVENVGKSLGIRVGIVDSGFRLDQQDLVEDGAAFILHDGALWMDEPSEDPINHGARLLDIIHHHAPEALVYAAQVFNQRSTTTAAQVAAAIDWLVSQQVRVINLSLGLRDDRPVLKEAVNKALSAGVILCASSPARGEPVYPSAYDGVIRMTGDARCALDEISWLNTQYADFGGHVLGFDQKQQTAGSSLGCAHMTGHITRLLLSSPDASSEAIVKALQQQAHYRGPERRLS